MGTRNSTWLAWLLAILLLPLLAGCDQIRVALEDQIARQESEIAKLEEEVRAVQHGTPAPAVAPTPQEPRTYWRYFDASGNLHFVDHESRVPSEYRASARPMGTSRTGDAQALPQINRTASAPARQPTRAAAMANEGGSPAKAYRPFSNIPEVEPRPDRVVVYTTSWCDYCRRTLDWLDDHDVDYENKDIEASPHYREELVRKTGSTSVPMVEIGSTRIRGYRPRSMERALF